VQLHAQEVRWELQQRQGQSGRSQVPVVSSACPRLDR
jgi:hypothetical protein